MRHDVASLPYHDLNRVESTASNHNALWVHHAVSIGLDGGVHGVVTTLILERHVTALLDQDSHQSGLILHRCYVEWRLAISGRVVHVGLGAEEEACDVDIPIGTDDV